MLAANYDLAGKVIGIAMKVHSGLGSGFLESVYKNALMLDLREAGFEVQRERKLDVRYRGVIVGEFFADIVVNDVLIVEVKAVQMIVKAHEVQLVNYLVATGLDQGLLVNFGAPGLEFKRKYRKIKPQS